MSSLGKTDATVGLCWAIALAGLIATVAILTGRCDDTTTPTPSPTPSASASQGVTR